MSSNKKRPASDDDNEECPSKKKGASQSAKNQDDDRAQLLKLLDPLLQARKPWMMWMPRVPQEDIEASVFDAIVEFLQKHPYFARERVQRYHQYFKLPLSLIAEAPGATLKHVKAIHELYPNAIRDPQRTRILSYTIDSILPIFPAIQECKCHEIIEFLIRAYPECLRTPIEVVGRFNALLIQFLLAEWTPKEGPDSDEHLKIVVIQRNVCSSLTVLHVAARGSLNQYEVLVEKIEQHNTVLEDIAFQGPQILNALKLKRNLAYLGRLNKCGREAARNSNTSIPDFVELLRDVVTTEESELSYLSVRGCDAAIEDPKHAILYGILRENPSVWSFGH